MSHTIPNFPSEELVPFTQSASRAAISFRGYTAESLLKAYKTAGPVFSSEINGEPYILLAGLDANEVAWRTPDNWSYGKAVAVFREELSELHLTQLDQEPHRRKRRLLNKGFKNSAAMSGMAKAASIIEAGFNSIDGNETELHHYLMSVLTKAQAATSVVEDFEASEIEQMVDFEEGFIGALFMKTHERELIYNRASYIDIKTSVLTRLHGIVRERLKREEPQDLLDEIVQQKTSTQIEPLSEEELIYDCYLMLIAGTGNTSKLTCYLIHALSQDEEWTTKLREELGAFNPRMFAEGMKQFPLLKATIMETERMFPAAPVLPRVPAEDIDFLGYPLTKDTQCLHLASLMHFDEEIYEDPFTFKPSRWLENNYPKSAHGTFGGGSHTCLGMNFARLQMPLIIGYLLSQYNFQVTKAPQMENYAYPNEVDSQTLRMSIKLSKI